MSAAKVSRLLGWICLALSLIVESDKSNTDMLMVIIAMILFVHGDIEEIKKRLKI